MSVSGVITTHESHLGRAQPERDIDASIIYYFGTEIVD